MRSLKIIFFRDTDKPYTVILSSSMLIGIAFSTVVLVSLLTFSVLSNVLLLSEKPAQGSERVAADSVTATRERPEEKPSDEGAPGESTEDAQQTDEMMPEGVLEEESVAEEPAESPEGRLEPWSAPDCPFVVSMLGGPSYDQSGITIRTLVRKVVGQGLRESGRYIAALEDANGDLGPVFPSYVAIEDNEVVNPDRGRLFTIANSIQISLNFANIDMNDYPNLIIFIFDEETKQLLWISREPIR